MSCDSLQVVPSWLQKVWSRDYIKQSFRAPRSTDTDNIVRYLQGRNLCVDMRLTQKREELKSKASLDELSVDDLSILLEFDCFAGVTKSDKDGQGRDAVSWYTIFSFPPSLSGDGNKAVNPQSIYHDILKGTASTEDRGIAVPEVPATEDANKPLVWLEFDVDTEGKELEERWVQMSIPTAESRPQASPDVASREDVSFDRGEKEGTPCMMVVVDGRFAYVRDLTARDQLFEKFGQRPLEEVVLDDTVPLSDKQALFGCEFSCGICNGSTNPADWSVEFSTHPWTEGKAPSFL
eukprot:TRINITY_DN32060_c0_g1_i1.p1 TRINITY_DN32060_c0_g1~~TRINITY_DN32060_c0_g1_i1.p1  ORF type:complete len:293 (+),score=37.91 TRINITY_DN32060_c0_g1_i1:107-985(+)